MQISLFGHAVLGSQNYSGGLSKATRTRPAPMFSLGGWRMPSRGQSTCRTCRELQRKRSEAYN